MCDALEGIPLRGCRLAITENNMRIKCPAKGGCRCAEPGQRKQKSWYMLPEPALLLRSAVERGRGACGRAILRQHGNRQRRESARFHRQLFRVLDRVPG